jgi:hypothetical protein
MRKKYTGEKAGHRRERQAERQRHIKAVKDNEVSEELPEVPVPDIFAEIHEIYREILNEFREEQKQAEAEKRKRLREEHEVGVGNKDIPRKPETSECGRVPEPLAAHQYPLTDGKVVKASYNAGVKERVVHVPEIIKDENGNRSRFGCCCKYSGCADSSSGRQSDCGQRRRRIPR